MKRLVIGFAAMALLLGVVGSALAAGGAVFGTAVPLTGPYAAMAEDMKKGSLLALEEINAAGGVMGKPARVIVRDSMLKGDVALRHFKEMAGEGIKFIGGNLSGGISLVANEYACKNQLLYMAYCHTSLPVGKEFCGWGFTAAVIPYQTTAALANFAFNKLGKKWVSLTADYRWGHDILAGWMVNSKKYGGQFKGNIYHPLGTRDYSAFIPKILAAKPDFIVLNNYGSDQTNSIKQFAELGLTKKIPVVISKTHIVNMKETGAAYNNNVYGSVTFYWGLQDKYPAAKKFVKKFWDKYGQPPSADGEAAYVATKALFTAMNKTKTTTDVKKVIKELVTMKLDTPKGVNRFRACDHVREQSILVVQGKGAAAKGWDLAKVVAEVPYTKTLESCANNKKDVPYGQVKLPGK